MSPLRPSAPVAQPRTVRAGPAATELSGREIRRFFLYGHEARPLDDRFPHCERIEEQLQQYDWDAKPHIHEGLHQIQYFEKGSGELLVESDWQPFKAPVLLFVPAGTVHGFHFSRDTSGFVLTLSRDFMDEVAAMVGSDIQRVTDAPRINILSPAEARQHALGSVLRLIEDDYQRGTIGRTSALISGMALMLVKIARLEERCSTLRSAGAHPYVHHFQKFRELVEKDFRTQPTVFEMASRLNMTDGRLTAICRAVADASPQQILHARLLVEAKRQLLYTVRASSTIAYALGFKDPAYFSRFFKRATGKTPKAFRSPGGDTTG
ncbi:MAG: helix-turn-helix domain-containing protein [Comamonadaceae bacterium]|nr:helix-turn-helix domain-containing protein [Comamonadaceae bacterium]